MSGGQEDLPALPLNPRSSRRGPAQTPPSGIMSGLTSADTSGRMGIFRCPKQPVPLWYLNLTTEGRRTPRRYRAIHLQTNAAGWPICRTPNFQSHPPALRDSPAPSQANSLTRPAATLSRPTGEGQAIPTELNHSAQCWRSEPDWRGATTLGERPN